ncbi:ABC transporter ATP-binding protein [Paenibacillus sp. BR2-3]|uniref:ABC transporter ATP-binding protein n=1 Tax=Paenibacillus sp. BR2-3 TaxID=3048494 RepID=UPI0039776A73
MIRTNHLSKVYKNGFKAVTDLNLQIDEGDIYGFLGPNGAGKTTTIRMLTGLLAPTQGDTFINGVNVKEKNTEIKKMVGVLPESHGYYNWMTGYEYLEYFYKLFGQDASGAKQHITYLLEKVGLSERGQTLVGQYSRGMKQRLGIAKTLINHPKVIFLDEPTLGLDPSGQRDIHELILELNKSMNITVFITSHLLKDIEVLCNKIAIVKNGNLLEQDTIENLLKKYSTDGVFRIRTSNNSEAMSYIQEINGFDKLELKEDYIEASITDASSIDLIKRQIVEVLFMNKFDIQEVIKVTTSVEDLFLKLVNDADKKEVQ